MSLSSCPLPREAHLSHPRSQTHADPLAWVRPCGLCLVPGHQRLPASVWFFSSRRKRVRSSSPACTCPVIPPSPQGTVVCVLGSSLRFGRSCARGPRHPVQQARQVGKVSVTFQGPCCPTSLEVLKSAGIHVTGYSHLVMKTHSVLRQSLNLTWEKDDLKPKVSRVKTRSLL